MTPARIQPDAITEAVAAGVRASCLYRNEPAVMASICPEPCRSCREDGPAVIVAFLRALPVTRSPTIEECQKARTTTIRPRINYAPDMLANEVERAAKGGGDE
jgi:hypothetical protein